MSVFICQEDMNKAFFIDRDGIIVEMVYDLENGTITTPLKPKNVSLVYGIGELLYFTKKLGFLNILISNQPNIGLKRISEKNFRTVQRKILQELKKEGIVLDGEYYCFHHPHAKIKKYAVNCNCRKPKPGLLLQAAKDNNIDLKKSFMLGDGVNDVIAGNKSGCKTILFANLLEAEYLRLIEKQLKGIKPDYIIKKLTEAIKILK